MRCVSTRVLPEPAPARTSSGPSPCTTASRCGGLSPSRSSWARSSDFARARSAVPAPAARRRRWRRPDASRRRAGFRPSSRRPDCGPVTCARGDVGGRAGSVPVRSAIRCSSCAIRSESAFIASATGSGRWTQSVSGPSGRRPSTRTGWPGLPTTVECGRHVVDHDRVGADLRAVADRDRAEQLRAGADRDVVLDGRVALAGGEARAAERDALVERHAGRRSRPSRRSRRRSRGR